MFDSKAECRRGEELALLERGGRIGNVFYQRKFVLCEKPKITITIDFDYMEKGHQIFEDTKGVLTRDFRTKLAWLKEKYGIDVVLSGKQDKLWKGY
ncbi:hypothetical protein LCGC14_2657270 [marine sediment metagenome]|uniref:DUF1064 domain-containing protein n=1 Tax=marine sediment metagenome TaxID=412755 RepID=A0A0F9CK30_9ZZZZ